MGSSVAVKFIIVSADEAGQRIDNFLVRHYKKVPKTRLYRAIRKGEVRVNKGRIKASYHLCAGDKVRMPPLYQPEPNVVTAGPSQSLQRVLAKSVILENDKVLVINKPSGLPVHGGTGRSCGLIEALRYMRPEAPFLELVHRLDKGTSGCLVIAKKRSYLRSLHALLRARQVHKEYYVLLQGRLQQGRQTVTAPLYKMAETSGERYVRVDAKVGKEAHSCFTAVVSNDYATLALVKIRTGRTHQIRVHAAYLGHPVAGDDKYGDESFNLNMRGHGLDRLFLHARSIAFGHSDQEGSLAVQAALPLELLDVALSAGLKVVK
jgi:23S rRNA pseudouridine955/2504/2580 synthase